MRTLALFDFDKTLTNQDTFLLFFWKRFLTFENILLILLESLKALPLLSKQKIAERVKLKIVKVCLSGVPAIQLHEMGVEFASRDIPNIINSSLLARLQDHLACGDEVWIVSASLATWLRPWCKTHKVNLLCTELEVSDSKMTGNITGSHCHGINKTILVRKNIDISQFQCIHVYGNMPSDQDMLALASSSQHRHVV